MPTSNSKLQPNQEIRVSSSKNPVAKKRFPSKNNIPLKKKSQPTENTLERNFMPLSFASEKHQEQDKENGTLNLDANKTKLIRPYFNIKKPPVAIRDTGGTARQRHAVGKTRGEYPSAKIQDSDGSRRKSQQFSSVRGKPLCFLLLLMLSILGVVQALTDCQIMNEWLPEMFDGTGTACCEHSGISCTGGRLEQMYVA
jgi:hypothetical protein